MATRQRHYTDRLLTATFLHERSQACSGRLDVDRRFESALTDYIGRLAADHIEQQKLFMVPDEISASSDLDIEMYIIFMFISFTHVTSFKCARLVNQNTYLQKLYSDRIFKYVYHEHFLKV